MPVQRYHSRGLRVGLGTDFGGGPSAGMLTAVRGAIMADQTVEFAAIERGDTVEHWPENKEVNWEVDFTYAYHLATVLPFHNQVRGRGLMVGGFGVGVGIRGGGGET